jgi:hypothetical protein
MHELSALEYVTGTIAMAGERMTRQPRFGKVAKHLVTPKSDIPNERLGVIGPHRQAL